MYSPLSVQRHLISSSILLVNCVSLMASQRSANSETSACEFGGYMWSIHLLFSRAFCTEIFFLCVFRNKLGAIVFTEAPLIHDEVQNKAVFPLPIFTTVDALKSSWSVLLHGTSRFVHALSFCFHLNHSHLNLKALVKLSKSKIPIPPFSFGRQVVGQFISECPPVTFSGVSPRQRKLRRNLSILLSTPFCAWKTVKW